MSLCEPYRVSETGGAILEVQDLLNVDWKGGDLRAFMNEWRPSLIDISRTPEIKVLEACLRMQLQGPSELKENTPYQERLPVGHLEKNSELLLAIVRRYPQDKAQQASRRIVTRWRTGPA